MVKPTIQFIQGTNEQTIPDVRLTKSRDGSNGMAIFTFTEPSVFDSSTVVGDITGFYMIDEEGVIQSVDVNAKFVNGKPAGIEAKYVMRTPREWDRFMRFMERDIEWYMSCDKMASKLGRREPSRKSFYGGALAHRNTSGTMESSSAKTELWMKERCQWSLEAEYEWDSS
ncbi:hypothetical protein SASPL_102848 [Salvia splendens]|uniref:Photosystem II reaction center Psb28 protein n=1 Tax=Salvia splendens TaxID=180675 RepID=A0A8X8YWP6_SALSN|nr:hypothetical protein SASPL_102848 [Salvia splendens]